MKMRQFKQRRFTRETPVLYTKVDMASIDSEGRGVRESYETLRFKHTPSEDNAQWRARGRQFEAEHRKEARLMRRHRPQQWKERLEEKKKWREETDAMAKRDLTQHPEHAARYTPRELRTLGFGRLISTVHRKPPYHNGVFPLYEETIGEFASKQAEAK